MKINSIEFYVQRNHMLVTSNLSKLIFINCLNALLSYIGLTINDARRGKTERATGVYKEVHEDWEQSFNNA
ncbi:MAG: hypothetical protein Tsb005_20960 [Gammaproteobacteria bacterium]